MDLTPGIDKLILQLSADLALTLHLSLDSFQLSSEVVLSLLMCSNIQVGCIQLMLPVLQLPPQLLTLTCLFSQLLLQLIVCLLAFRHVVPALHTMTIVYIPVETQAHPVQPHMPVLH